MNIRDTLINTRRGLDKKIGETKIKIAKTGSPNYRSLLKHLENHKLILSRVESYFNSNISPSQSEEKINFKRNLWREKNVQLLRDVYGIPIEPGDGSSKYPWAIWTPGY